MLSISKHHRFANITPQDLRSKFPNHSTIFLPPSIKDRSSNHYWESTGNLFGFELTPPWEALPAGVWKVTLKAEASSIPKVSAYNIDVTSGQEKIYTGDLKIKLSTIESDTTDTIMDVTVEGKRELVLESYSDDLIETIIRSLIRESCEYLEQTILNQAPEPLSEEDQNLDHMAPLAVAAGVFSAGMALGVWFWRRKRKT